MIEPPGGFDAKNDVLGHGEHRNQHEMLVDHADPGCDAIARPFEPHRFAIDQDFTLVGRVEPRKDVHHGRLARAVLAEQA